MKKLLTLILLTCLLTFTWGCMENSSDGKMAEQTEKSMQEMNRQIGMPAIKNFQERKLAKMIFELRDQAKLITYTYVITMTGRKILLGKSIGYGLPYSVQYTNPMKLIRRHSGGESHSVPQADPNGLYMPSGLSATWVMLINPKTGKASPAYVEQEILVSTFKL